MKVRLHSQFISDLVEIGDANLPGRVLQKVFDGSGNFIERSRDDHRYKGIDNAWIRYAGQGKNALRVIFIRNGDEVVLYRAGHHSVEDRLKAPRDTTGLPVISDEVISLLHAGPGNGNAITTYAAMQTAADQFEELAINQDSRILYNHAERFMYGSMLGRRFLPHKEVYLVSPFVSFDLLRPTSPFGQLLDELISDGATVCLITQPPSRRSNLISFDNLEARKISVFFHTAIHSKIYAFILDRDRLGPDQSKSEDFVTIGSADLTTLGLRSGGSQQQELQFETNYQTQPKDWQEIESYILHVAELSTDLRTIKSNLLDNAKRAS